MTKDIEKLAFVLLNNYAKLYQLKYDKKPTLNKYKEKWGASSLIEDFGIDEVDRVLNYYFKLQKDKHPLVWFYSNFESLLNALNNTERDNKLRAERRIELAKIRKEFLNGNA